MMIRYPHLLLCHFIELTSLFIDVEPPIQPT